MTDELLAEQITYYRQRAAEYDATAYGDLADARQRIERILALIPTAGTTLEIACGTGMWTESLAHRPGRLTALDAAPEALAIARQRGVGGAVEWVCADVFGWQPPQHYDLIFSAFWLSHVPDDRLDVFLHRLDRALAPGGRIVFVDEHASQVGTELIYDPLHQVAERTLGDGSIHRLVKVFLDPATFIDRLAAHGWRAQVARDGSDWIVATVSRAEKQK